MVMKDVVYIDVDDLKSPTFSESYLRLSRMGWVYDGLHHAGGGMGCHVCHEFKHEKWGRLSFEAEISHMEDGEPTWRECEQHHPFRDYSSWFLMLDGNEHDRGNRVDAGNSLDELEEVLGIHTFTGLAEALDFADETVLV